MGTNILKIMHRPVWTEKHTKMVEEYKKKHRTGKQIYYGYKDIEDFFLDLHGNHPMMEYGMTIDKYGNKTFYKTSRINNCGGYIP